MDDLLLFTPTKESHFAKLEDLLRALCKNGLKISPKKCQLFAVKLQYMDNTIFIKDRRVCVKPLKSRLEAIQKLKHPTMIKDCRSFAGMVNFVSIFCPELQTLMKPIYNLTIQGRHCIWGEEQQTMFEPIYNLTIQGRHCIWGEEQQTMFEEIKKGYKNPQFYICQIGEVDFYCILTQANMLLVVLCTKFRMVFPNLLHTLVKECQKQLRITPITELEMCGLAINNTSFAYLFKKGRF